MNFLFSSFWTFIGVMSIVAGFAYWLYSLLFLFWRHRNIVKSGYPPAHCDAFGYLIKKERPVRERPEKKSGLPAIKDIKLFHSKRPDSTPASNPLKSFDPS